jgi:hypothetical protein
VIPGSAADQGSGLQPGDLILAVNGVHISDWDEDKLLEAFRGEDIIGSKCRLTIERPEAKHLGPVDVEVLRTNASFAKEVELLFLLGQEHASLLQSQASYDSLNASLQAIMHQAVALERHRILHEQILGSRLRSLQMGILESVTEAEKQIKGVESAGGRAASKQIQDLEERFMSVSDLLEVLSGPPAVPPSELASAIKDANMSAQDVLTLLKAVKAGTGPNSKQIKDLEERFLYVSELLSLLQGPPLVDPTKLARAVKGAKLSASDLLSILDAISNKSKSAEEVVGLINGGSKNLDQEAEIADLRGKLAAMESQMAAKGDNKDQEAEIADLRGKLAAKDSHLAAKDVEIAGLQSELNASLQPQVCMACPAKEQEIESLKKQLEDQKTSVVRVEKPKVSRSAAPPPVQAPLPPRPPSFVPPAGTFNKQISATINSNEPGAKIYYTTDGSAPSETNFKQTGMAPLTIEVKESTLIKAIAVADGRVGKAGEVNYDIPVLAGTLQVALHSLLLSPVTMIRYPTPSRSIDGRPHVCDERFFQIRCWIIIGKEREG